MPERVVSFQGQSFHKLRRYCQRRGVVFKDPLFPASAQSLFFKRELPPGLSWKRPREICRDPRLFVDGISTRDLHQGSLGNCWMVAAISCLASEPSLWKKVIPDHMEQEWNPKRPDLYAGIFHFRFWRFGSWVDVVVDDRLPVSADGALLFCRSATPREFWSALLEKAYAKLNGCYEALEGGNTAEALIDFTGGVSEPLSLDREALSLQMDQRRALFQTLAQAHERKALITCFIRPLTRLQSVMECGLVRGHAYGITALKKVHVAERLSTGRKSRLLLLRMRNPWGTTDWTGAWGQGSQQWQQISRTDREKMGLAVRDIGEFWMEFEDFCHYFTDVVVCRLHARSQLSGVWDEQMDKRSRCGGCINHRDTFLHNPQFLFEVRGKEEEVLICLQQEDRRMRRKNGDGENLPIGFEVLKVEVNRFSRVQTVVEQAASSVYMDSRSVTVRACFSPGRYVVLPTTFLPGATGRFLLRLFSHSHIHELLEDLPAPSVFHCLLPQPTVVTTVHLCRVTGLSPGVYAVVRCENDSVRTPVFKAEGNPEFNLRSIFYRRYPRVHISIELWRKGVLWDSMLGEVRLKTAESERGRSHVMDLRRGLSRATVYLETSSSLCLTDL
uniref:Calpain catalytic domain-containing protein n=1 Tax=Periophthalmus magnuspinnatus TaxID=409849 RepID=A0A3B3ZGW6_9GOBI